MLKCFGKYHEIINDGYDVTLFIYFSTVIFVIVLFTFYYSCMVFIIFMARFNIHFSFYYSCHYSYIVFVSLYKAYESIVLGRHGKTGGSGRVNRVCGSRVKTGQSSCGSSWVDPYFSNKFFFFFNYKNKSMTTYLERMNKIN